jgi:hypothetical protein
MAWYLVKYRGDFTFNTPLSYNRDDDKLLQAHSRDEITGSVIIAGTAPVSCP